MPTRSAVRKQPLFGRAVAGPETASTSSTVRPSSTMWWIALHIAKTPMRFATKFGVSLPNTIPLPSRRRMSSAIPAATAGSVSRAATISTSRM